MNYYGKLVVELIYSMVKLYLELLGVTVYMYNIGVELTGQRVRTEDHTTP